jgi:hypothetical protein
MKNLVLLSLYLTFAIVMTDIYVSTSCVESHKYIVMLCENTETTCYSGNLIFLSKKDCENFVEAASKTQPSVARACVEQ